MFRAPGGHRQHLLSAHDLIDAQIVRPLLKYPRKRNLPFHPGYLALNLYLTHPWLASIAADVGATGDECSKGVGKWWESEISLCLFSACR